MNKETLENLKEYLQDKIDNGYHKIFYNDLMWDVKTIDCINAINDTLEEIERLNNIINEKNKEIEDYSNKWCELAKAKTKSDNIINELEKYLNEQIQKSWEIEEQCYETILDKLQELKGSDKE